MILKDLTKLADKLDKKGLYSEASILDDLIKKAIRYPKDYDQDPMQDPESWGMAMMEMDISPKAIKNKKRYKRREIPTEEKDIEDLIFKNRILVDEDEDNMEDIPDWDIFRPDYGYPSKSDDEDLVDDEQDNVDTAVRSNGLRGNTVTDDQNAGMFQGFSDSYMYVGYGQLEGALGPQ